MKDEEASLRGLVEHVFQHRDGLIDGITYQQLAARIRRLNKHGERHGHGMGLVLGRMGHLLLDLEGEWGEPIPHIQSLVVNKSGPNRGLPDDGIREFWPDYPKMTRAEKQDRVRLEHAKVVQFGSRWNDVLRRLELAPVTATNGGSLPGNGGESPAHKALKEFVKANPGLVGAPAECESFTEFATPSLDSIDVFFRNGKECVAVEVKAAVSDAYPSDYERGLYQVVKYRALLHAMRSDQRHSIPGKIKVVLLIQSTLPAVYRSLADALDVTVIEKVEPTFK